METSQLGLIDTHCHLYSSEFDVDRTEIVKRAIDTGVSKMMLPNIDLDSISLMWDLVHQYPDHCFPMMGLHPCSVKEDYQEILDQMRAEIESGRYMGVGETGIDMFWDKTFKKEQIDSFEQHILWAREHNLPIIIHSRESLDLTIDIITQHQDGNLKGIFHCFSGDYAQVRRIERTGFKVGIGGVLTYKKAGLFELLPQIPLEMIVLETDAPYLSPVPYRGRRNEPAYLLVVGQWIADGLNLPLGEVARISSENAEAVYGKKD